MCCVTDRTGGGFVSVGGGGGGGLPVWDMAELDAALGGGSVNSDNAAGKKKSTTAEEFLGQNANLVNLNELVVRPPPSSKTCIIYSK